MEEGALEECKENALNTSTTDLNNTEVNAAGDEENIEGGEGAANSLVE